MQIHLEVNTDNLVIDGLTWDEGEPEWSSVTFDNVELIEGKDYDPSELASELIEQEKTEC